MKGGQRQGAGRPKGIPNKDISLRKKIVNFFSEEDIVNLVNEAKKQAFQKPELMKFLLEQIFGRAYQRMELTGKDGERLSIVISKEASERFGIPGNEIDTSTSEHIA